jgi:hypothetical protein
MDHMACDFAAGVDFLFGYVREAHPDHHKIFEQKWQHALNLRERHMTPRNIVVDSLDGDIHRMRGGRPNMSWITDYTGHVVYKADWANEPAIGSAPGETLRIRELKHQGGVRNFYRETITVIGGGRPDAAGTEGTEKSRA